jgi:phosphonate transport system substrate-binding protein
VIISVYRLKKPLNPRAQVAGILMLALLVVCTRANASDQVRELYFGSVAMDIPAMMHQRLQPLARYLSEGLGRPVTLKLSPDMDSAILDIKNGSVDLAYLTPVAYLKAHSAGNARLLVKTITEGWGSFKLMIAVKENSPIKSVADLKGKTFAFGDRAALLQRAVVVNAGMNLEDFRDYKFIGHYDNIVRGVLNGDFDAGILKDTMAYKWQGKGIRIIYASPELPPYNISVSKNVSDDTFLKLKALFLSLNDSDPRHLEIINAVDHKYTGFATVGDAEYDIVRKLIKPFELP